MKLKRHTFCFAIEYFTRTGTGRLTQSYRALPATPTTPIIYSTSTYTYDNIDRITNHVIDTANPTNSTGYQYDLSGNRTNLNLGANHYPSTIATTSNRLTADTGSINRTYSYDGAGNITGDGQDIYTYYNSGRLKQVTRNGNNIYSLQYNGLGQFVHRTNNNTHYVYDAAGHLLGEYTSNGTPIQETIYLGDTPIAVITPTNQVNYIYTDHLNTPREIRNHANQIRWTWYSEQSGAFGAGLPDDNPNNAIGGQLGTFTYNLRFPGQLYDPASQLSYNYYRDYNSRTGRYIQSDPIGLKGGINTYGYVGANPISYVDPMGLVCVSVNNRMTCSIPSGPAFSVPSPKGQPKNLGSNSSFYHETNVSRDLDGADPECVMKELTNSPTPGIPNAASPQGTPNNARTYDVFGDNLVKSYLTPAHGSGMPIVVNTAGVGDGSDFGPGYVARYVQGGRAYTKGEGTSMFQSIGPLSNRENEKLWGKDLERIIKKCKCQ